MNTFAKIEFAFRSGKITFYSIHVEGRDLSEFDDFQKFFLEEDDKYSAEYDELVAFIEEIGKRGANPGYFRHEGEAKAIPVEFCVRRREVIVGYNNPIRLYCIPLGRQAVILMNGGIKTEDNPNDCTNVATYFREARCFARAVDKGLVAGSLCLKDGVLDLLRGDEIEVRL